MEAAGPLVAPAAYIDALGIIKKACCANVGFVRPPCRSVQIFSVFRKLLCAAVCNRKEHRHRKETTAQHDHLPFEQGAADAGIFGCGIEPSPDAPGERLIKRD